MKVIIKVLKTKDCQGLQCSNRPFSYINWQFRRYLKAVKSSLAHFLSNAYFLPTNYMPKYIPTYRPVFNRTIFLSAGFYIRNTIRWHLKWRSKISWKLSNLWNELLYSIVKTSKTVSKLKISITEWMRKCYSEVKETCSKYTIWGKGGFWQTQGGYKEQLPARNL